MSTGDVPIPQQSAQLPPIAAKFVKELKKRVVAAASTSTTKTPLIPIFNNNINISSNYGNATSNKAAVRRKNIWQFNSFEMHSSLPQQQATISCVALPFAYQERLIISELLYCLIGMRGTFITLEPQPQDTGDPNIVVLKPLKFIVSDQVNVSLRQMVMDILPLASHYSQVQQFVDMYDTVGCSAVLQALAAAVRQQLNDYVLALVQLETELKNQQRSNDGGLGIHKLQYCLGPIMTTMRILAEILATIVQHGMGGARVLSLLHSRIVSLMGDGRSQDLLCHLTELAAVPFFKVLQLWILKGVICDPHNEFMIEDNEVIRREEMETNQYSASYWEKRYAIRREGVPRFLEKVSEIILRTGKYLNVIRQCGNTVPACTDTLHFVARNEQLHMDFIKTAYRSASRTLLELLVHDKDLMGHLTSVKRYLLMHQGDFITEFMDASDEELSKNINDVLPMKLDNLLGLTLRTSSAKHDRYKDNLVCNLITTDVMKMMSQIHLVGYATRDDNADESVGTAAVPSDSFTGLTGFDCFAFRYEIQWPVSLIMNNMAESKYQMLFRFLFYCKHVERQLYKVWANSTHKSVIKFETRAAGGEALRFVFSLRQRMMYAIQNVEYYMMVEVIEPMWHGFLQKMEHVENVDEVLAAHHDFIDKCLESCMLKTPELLRIVISICKVCLDFCAFTKCELKLRPTAAYLAQVKQCDAEFSTLLLSLLMRINDIAFENPSGKFINLVHRINFNGFYTDALEACKAKQLGVESR